MLTLDTVFLIVGKRISVKVKTEFFVNKIMACLDFKRYMCAFLLPTTNFLGMYCYFPVIWLVNFVKVAPVKVVAPWKFWFLSGTYSLYFRIICEWGHENSKSKITKDYICQVKFLLKIKTLCMFWTWWSASFLNWASTYLLT